MSPVSMTTYPHAVPGDPLIPCTIITGVAASFTTPSLPPSLPPSPNFSSVKSLHVNVIVHIQWHLPNTDTLGTKIIFLISEASLFQRENNMYLYKVGTQSSVLINKVSLFQGCPLREVPLYFKAETQRR